MPGAILIAARPPNVRARSEPAAIADPASRIAMCAAPISTGVPLKAFDKLHARAAAADARAHNHPNRLVVQRLEGR